MNPGQLDRRVVFRRAPLLAGAGGGGRRGPFADYLTVWAGYTRASGREAIEAGRLGDVEAGALRIRDTARARTLTIEDRVLVGGVDYRLAAIALPDRRSGTIEITITTARTTP